MRFIWIQTYRIFYFSRRLFAKHHTISSWCRILRSRSRSRKIRIFSISKFFLLFLSQWYRFYWKLHLTNFSSKKITGENFCSDRTRTTSLLIGRKPISMTSSYSPKISRGLLLRWPIVLSVSCLFRPRIFFNNFFLFFFVLFFFTPGFQCQLQEEIYCYQNSFVKGGGHLLF